MRRSLRDAAHHVGPPAGTRVWLSRPGAAGDDPERDAAAVAALRADPAVMRHLGGAVDAQEAARRLARDQAHWSAHGYGMCVVRARETGAFVGYAGLRCFEGDPDLSYLIVPELWGRGLASEVARQCAQWAFDGVGATLLRAATDRGHRVSQRVLVKTGLRYVGERILAGSPQCCYAMTRGDWALRCAEAAQEG